jgi:hypothetical protein
LTYFFEEKSQEHQEENDAFVEGVAQEILPGLCCLCQSTQKMNKAKGFILIGTMKEHNCVSQQ